jgi:hypothetical protein
MGSTGATSGASGTSGTDGNASLQGAFDKAIASATATLNISTTGQATLNALRARPN